METMNDSYNIPFTINPPIKTYPGYAFVLSLIFANSDRYFPWLLNHYIHVLGNDTGTRYEFMPADPFYVSEGVMEYMTTSIFPDMLCDNRSFYDIVTAMLREGFGMMCWMNERYIPNRLAYQRYDFVHDNMIVGYNDKERSFLILGYAPSGQYISSLVPVDQIALSLTNGNDSAVALNFIRPNSDFLPAFCRDTVDDKIRHYLESTSIGEMGYSEFYGERQWETGIAATQKLASFPVQKTGYYDIRLFSFLKDRVTLMHQRAKYMMDNGYIPYDEMLSSDLLRTVKLANNAHLLAIKYNVLRQEHCVSTIQGSVEQIVQIEKNVFPRLLKIIV